MTDEVTHALLPCPFCGGEAEWKDDPGICGVPFGLVVDHKPDCFLAFPLSEGAQLSAWNTRLTAQSGEGRSGAGEDAALKLVAGYVDYTTESKDRWEQGKAAGYRELGSIVAAALNARQSGEGERGQ